MKWVVKSNNSYDRTGINHIFKNMVEYLNKQGKLSLKIMNILELITEWINSENTVSNNSMLSSNSSNIYQSSSLNSMMMSSTRQQLNA